MKSEFPDYKRISFHLGSRSSTEDSKKREKFRRTMVSPEWSITRVPSVLPDEKKKKITHDRNSQNKKKNSGRKEIPGEFLGWQYLEEACGCESREIRLRWAGSSTSARAEVGRAKFNNIPLVTPQWAP